MDVDPVQTITLDSTTESTLTGVHLYPSQAQLTRSYKFDIEAGETMVLISNLTNVLDTNTVRVEGRGPATIHDVTCWRAERQDEEEDGPEVEALLDEKYRIEEAIKRAKQAETTIGQYMTTLNVQHLDISKLGEAMEIYDTTMERWDLKLDELDAKREDVDKRIKVAREKAAQPSHLHKLRNRINVRLYAHEAGEVELILVYAVSHCGWNAGYDVRVDMKSDDGKVNINYKALIKQKTGEEWKEVPLVLHTTKPVFGIESPSLDKWTVNIRPEEDAIQSYAGSGRGRGGRGLGKGGAKRHRKILRDDDDLDFDEDDYMEHTFAEVTSDGDLSATFTIPGMTTIPPDDEVHTLTIVDLRLPTKMSWLCMPKVDQRVHLKARIKNDSAYTFLPGTSNVYVDRTFIAQSDLPHVHPMESVEYSLGVDPTLRVDYPSPKNVSSESGFLHKQHVQSFQRTITVSNNKSIKVSDFRVVDSIPVSQNAALLVNLIEPGLPRTAPASAGGGDDEGEVADVRVRNGVLARWGNKDGSDRSEVGDGRSGNSDDGIVEWVCELGAHSSVNFTLKWEATVPVAMKDQLVGF